jgi:hypothetical protein
MCHGIVREYCRKYDRVGLFADPRTYDSVAFMYHDIANLSVIRCDHLAAPRYLTEHAREYTEVKKIGYELLSKTSGIPLERQLYALAAVPFEKKWDNFHVERDRAREQSFVEKVAPKGAYAFLHEDPSRDYIIKRHLMNNALPVVEASATATATIFDYCGIIERAQEIHVIDSSFMFLVDCLSYDNPAQKLYVHRYARPNAEWTLPVLKKNWVIIGKSSQGRMRKIFISLKNKIRNRIAQ